MWLVESSFKESGLESFAYVDISCDILYFAFYTFSLPPFVLYLNVGGAADSNPIWQLTVSHSLCISEEVLGGVHITTLF
jgi:hypothetical protein